MFLFLLLNLLTGAVGVTTNSSLTYALPLNEVYSNSIKQLGRFGLSLTLNEIEASKTMVVSSSPDAGGETRLPNRLRGSNYTTLMNESVHIFKSVSDTTESGTDWNEGNVYLFILHSNISIYNCLYLCIVDLLSSPNPNEQYGTSVALSNQSSNIAVGAPCNEEYGTCAGAVYIYNNKFNDYENWSLKNLLKPLYVDESQYFGAKVVAHVNQYDILLVGSPRLNNYPTDDYANGSKNSLVPTSGGFVYVYFLNNSEYVKLFHLFI